jgi:hypothetical protein
MTRHRVLPALIVMLVVTGAVPRAQEPALGASIWREFAATLQPGAAITLRLTTGQRVNASLLQVSSEAITIQPRTRVPVPPQRVAYADIESLELRRTNGGIGIGKAVAIGAAVGAGAFLGLLMIALATLSD